MMGHRECCQGRTREGQHLIGVHTATWYPLLCSHQAFIEPVLYVVLLNLPSSSGSSPIVQRRKLRHGEGKRLVQVTQFGVRLQKSCQGQGCMAKLSSQVLPC